MALGENIKRLRELRKWSVDELADRMGIGRAGIYKWENNETKPGLDSLIELSKALDVTLDELVKENLTPVQEPAIKKNLPINEEREILIRNLDRMGELVEYLLQENKNLKSKG